MDALCVRLPWQVSQLLDGFSEVQPLAAHTESLCKLLGGAFENNLCNKILC
jgi:hypothetical protein